MEHAGNPDIRFGIALSDQWKFYNNYYLNDSLREPSFDIFQGTSRFGYWQADDRVIGISHQHLLDHPWTRVAETLRHEMAHQFVDEVLENGGLRPHGDAFRYACQRLRVSHKAGESWYFNNPSQSKEGDNPHEDTADPLINKISKLLSLAQSPNENEAQLAMNKARELLLKHQISLDDLDKNQNNHPRSYQFLEMGSPKSRFAQWEKKLMFILQEYFFVKILWTPGLVKNKLSMGSVPLAHGTHSNLAMAQYVHGFFINLLPNLWKEFKKNRGITSDKPRQEYYFGVLYGFAEKLHEQNKHFATTKSLIWKGDPQLDDFYHSLHPHIQSRRSSKAVVGQAFQEGHEKGRSVTLNRPIHNASGSRDNKPRFLK